MAKSRAEPSSAARPGTIPGTLTRAQVASRLGISLSEVKRRERAGLIKPASVNEQGWHLYSVDQLDEIGSCTASSARQKRLGDRSAAFSGDDAARVFGALSRGKSLADCVVKFSLHPAAVEAIAAARARLDLGMFVSGAVMEEINQLELPGTYPITSDAELVEIMKEASRSVCKACERRAPSYCQRCVTKMTEAARDEL